MLPLDLPATAKRRRIAFSRRRELEAGQIWEGRTMDGPQWTRRRVVSVVDDQVTYYDEIQHVERECDRATFLKWAHRRLINEERLRKLGGQGR